MKWIVLITISIFNNDNRVDPKHYQFHMDSDFAMCSFVKSDIDYVFKDPAKIDWSISCAVIASSLFSAIMLWRCLQPFAEGVREKVN